jgi:hypothetical protein
MKGETAHFGLTLVLPSAKYSCLSSKYFSLYEQVWTRSVKDVDALTAYLFKL